MKSNPEAVLYSSMLSPHLTDLRLYERFCLLALRDEEGTIAVSFFNHALAGALIAELILRGRVRVSSDKKRLVDLASSAPLENHLLDECMGLIAEDKKARNLKTWIGRFASIKDLQEKATRGLCQRGILNKEHAKVLFVFSRTVYPEIDPAPEQALLKRLETIIFSDAPEVEPEDAVIVSLANANRILELAFGRKRIKQRRQRIKQIVEGDLVGNATREVIESIQAAVVVGAVVASAVVTAT
ncbi:GPP34 family phosphoprotein [Pelagicoccus sp. SDUM812003]|uniref:GOLPH3/VPS74 family protein n=1 Tax=Pelagicoccus sp. SDUM812003 TaxID=3041267 RepID=UPI00280EA7D7|nr:GPP34 family phosphoprotein [Pelagicoccus sp. SDUM812003]MDQ8205065.1 GPP34 family phosphoprotein [Pelagicoccus sp. SDUM812003]